MSVDLFMTETCRYADIVLPACSGLERCDVKIFNDNYIQALPPAIDPLGESRHDIQILLELADALGLDDPHLKMSYQDYMNFIIAPSGLTVEEIQANGGIMMSKNFLPPYEEKKYKKTGFKTRSGKVELKSVVVGEYAGAYGLDPLPAYRSCQEMFPQYAGEEYPLMMNTGSRKPQYMHSRTYRIDWIAELEDNDIQDLHGQGRQGPWPEKL